MEQPASTALQEEGRMCSFCGFLMISELGLTSSSCSTGQTLGLRQESFILTRQSVFFLLVYNVIRKQDVLRGFYDLSVLKWVVAGRADVCIYIDIKAQTP